MIKSTDIHFLHCNDAWSKYSLKFFADCLYIFYIFMSIGVVVRMSILDSNIDGSIPSINMFSP